MEFTVVHILHIQYITVTFLCGIFILILREAKRPTVFMAIDRIFTAILFLINFLQNYNMPYYGLTLFNPIQLIIALVIFSFQIAYIFSLMRPDSVRTSYWLKTLAPAVTLSFLYLVVIAIKGRLPVISNYSQLSAYIGKPELWLRLFAMLAFIVEISILSLKSFRMYRQHIRNLHSDFSYTEGVSLNWINWFIYITILRGFFSVVSMVYPGHLTKIVGFSFFILEAIVITIWVLRQKDLYRQPSKEELAEDKETVETEELLSEKIRKKLKHDLLTLLEKDEIFKDPELDRETVCEMLGVNRTYLSQIITHDMNTTFYQLINTYRLNKSVKMMENSHNQDIPLKNISKICGFKSASAFSIQFKQKYGKTPTEYWEG